MLDNNLVLRSALGPPVTRMLLFICAIVLRIAYDRKMDVLWLARLS